MPTFFDNATFTIFSVALLLTPIVLLGLAVPYAILRNRDASGQQQDPHIGLKSALYYFFSLAILVAVYGVNIFVVDVLTAEQRKEARRPQPAVNFGPPPAREQAEEFPNADQRNAMALILSGVALALVHLALVKVMTNDSKGVATRRMFAGARFAIIGLALMIAFIALVLILFQKEPVGEGETRARALARNSLYGVLLTWGPTWGIHLGLLWYYSKQLYRPRIPSVTLADD